MLASQVRDQFRLVPMWQRLGPDDSRIWFRRHALRSARWHAPVLLVGLAAAAEATRGPQGIARRSAFLHLALIGVALHGGVTLVVHVPANAMLLSARRSDRSDVLLKRWVRWHRIRMEAL